MKKQKWNKFYIIALVVSICGGIAYGFVVSPEAFMQEMKSKDFAELMKDSETAHKNVEQITVCPEDNRYFWMVKLKNPPSDRLVKKFKRGEVEDLLQKASLYRVKTIILNGQTGPSALLQRLLGVQ